MPSLHLRGLSFAHTTAVPVLDTVDLDLAATDAGPTWVGVVGANGSGKSTLLRLLAGELRPTAGELAVLSELPPVLVPQGVRAQDARIATFATAWDGHAERLRSRLDLDPDDLDAGSGRGWHALSPGQRKRWQVAAALATDPDVLLLDEPTNHLDRDARDLLVTVLRRHRGLGVVVTHDRALLDELTTRTVRLRDGGAVLATGPYSEVSARWREEEAAQRREHERARAELRRERRILAEVRRDRHGAEAGSRRERRLAGHQRPDAREAGRRVAQDKAEAALAGRVHQMNSRVARAEDRLAGHRLERDHRGAVGFGHEPTGRAVLAEIHGVVHHAGGVAWLHDVDVVLRRGDRVHLRGVNGAGKSSLLTAVVDRLTAAGTSVATLSQDPADPAGEAARVRSLEPALRGRVLGTAARLGVDPGRVLASDRASPGEARKLALARLLVESATVVVLDEPTNHLDLPAIERLEEALATFDGTLLLVTHDDALAAATTTVQWWVRDQTVETRSPDEA